MDLALTCQEIKQQLSGYLDGELDAAVCAELERHLRDCDNCRVVVDTVRKTILLYREYARGSAPKSPLPKLVRLWRS
jgi:anti-sigma factor RsiW